MFIRFNCNKNQDLIALKCVDLIEDQITGNIRKWPLFETGPGVPLKETNVVNHLVSRGGGGDSNMKCADVCVDDLENVPILKEALGKKKYTHIEGILSTLNTHIVVQY